MMSPRNGPAVQGGPDSIYKDILESAEQSPGRKVYQQELYKPSYAPQPVPQQPLPYQRSLPAYDSHSQPITQEQEPEPLGSWKPWAGIVAGATSGLYVAWEVARSVGTVLYEKALAEYAKNHITSPGLDPPDVFMYTLNAPAAVAVITAISLGVIGGYLGLVAYNDDRQRQGLGRIGGGA
ncbi:MAG: hypothetical protein V1887_00925 [Candidatus Aenigmatarchaeota archaeon]